MLGLLALFTLPQTYLALLLLLFVLALVLGCRTVRVLTRQRSARRVTTVRAAR
jgi:hypothetical protein